MKAKEASADRVWTCMSCSAEAKVVGKTVRNWQVRPDGRLCPECVAAQTCVRSVTVPVGTILEGGTWEEFVEALKHCWREGTCLANWAVTELARCDAVRPPDPKAGRMPKLSISLYSRFREHYPWYSHWDNICQSAQTIFKTVEANYRADRWEAVWMRSRSLRTYKYPLPFPVPGQAVKQVMTKGGGYAISVPLAGKRFAFILKTGDGFARQAADIRRWFAGEAKVTEVSFLQHVVSQSSHRMTFSSRQTDSGERRHYRIMVKLVMYVPRKLSERVHTINLFTDPKTFWVTKTDDRPDWIVNADHVRNSYLLEKARGSYAEQVAAWEAEHEARRQRLSEDLKAEKRSFGRPRGMTLEALQRRCEKHKRRVFTFIKEAVGQFVNYAVRRKAALVIYDDSDRSYIESFPWAATREHLKRQLAAKGIVLQVPGKEQEPEVKLPEADEVLKAQESIIKATRRFVKKKSRPEGTSDPSVTPLPER